MVSKMLIFLFCAIVSTFADESKHWAVIVAGSNGWFNYRHQADACHAYQIVIRNGIPPERIITMMYDDIAFNEQNPTPGKIINKPNGTDVYHGVKIDYKKEDVNPKNFLKVLRGDQAGMAGVGSGKVLNSGPNDHVFVNFVDHGAPGILAFGDDFLHAKDLKETIMYMHSNNKYKEMVFYVEACESGSMFANSLLPKNINVFATTAANPHESSYACYFDKARQTYLGDVYSVMWMQDSDKEDISSETLQKQFKIVKQETNTSHVMEYGNLTMGEEDVSQYQGGDNAAFIDDAVYEEQTELPNPNLDAVPSEDVELNILQYKLNHARGTQQKRIAFEQLEDYMEARRRTAETFKHIVALSVGDESAVVYDMMTQRRSLYSLDCYKPVVEHLRANCPRLNIVKNDYGLRHLYTLVNLCERPTPVETITEAIDTIADETDLC